MHALDWIEQHGRFLRTIGADTLRTELARQNRECTWCGQAVAGRRRNWCSKECVDEFHIRTPQGARWAVRQRDRGVCSICGYDTERIERVLMRARGLGFGVYCAYRDHLTALGFNADLFRDLWEADHIIPVAEGGGLCGLDGLRTLCQPCHKAESRRLAARLATSRMAR